MNRAARRRTKIALACILGAAALAACGLSVQGTFDGAGGLLPDGASADQSVSSKTDGSVDGGSPGDGANYADAAADGATTDGETSDLDGGHDAAACMAACPVDAGGYCTGDGVCHFDCVEAGACKGKTTCPPGVACAVACDGGCGGGIDCSLATSCSITCNAPNSCGAIMCGGPPPSMDASATIQNCTIDCIENNSCADIMTNAGTSNIDCTGNNSCGNVTCAGDTCTLDCDGGQNCKTVKCCATTCKDDAIPSGC